ncbi:hypothetical protein V5799_004533 [Amblyomma americanum]|uniref:Alpha-amylase n=1 Tax=Amblyomma americanum TaxID=6943 RepID=A0AAQ4D5U3_AMBAM
MIAGRSVVVHLFEWRFDDIADECEMFLGPRGYGAVQTSPVNENAIVFEGTVKRPWYERYQPVSYKLQTRSGNETQFRDMVRRCNQAGVRVYVDVVLNHMTGLHANDTGTAGTTYDYRDRMYPGVPYGPEDFHTNETCGTASGSIEDYKNARQVRNCELVGMRDLDQSIARVQAKMVEFLNRLIGFGVAGFRIDAAKHMWPEDLEVIFAKLDDLSTEFFHQRTRPFIYQEVIDMDNGEAVTRWEYQGLGRITEFLYGSTLGAIFRKRPLMLLKHLRNYGEPWGFLPSDEALAFVDNHDNQRGHGAGGADILTFFEPRLYKMAVAFMLAWPYGLPRVMSSYRWPRDIVGGEDRNAWMGPPCDEAWRIKPVVRYPNESCGNDWVCEHRWPQISNLVHLRKVAGNKPVTKWWDNKSNAIAFGRGNSTFILINNEDHVVDVSLKTSLPAGVYCDVVSGGKTAAGCTGRTVTVDIHGMANFRVDNAWEHPMVAVHVEVSCTHCLAS